uniref:Uncharacterized protein n=1 Tax=Rangifer tarandus platyrhynchus TaxID=3082113 RepID=A0ACB0DXZ0_RANTA|nr:unnamed protein product [Rangifer tarandus platyrhynchus]
MLRSAWELGPGHPPRAAGGRAPCLLRRLLNLPQLPQASLFGPFLCNQSWPSPWVWSLSFSNQPQPDAHRVSQRGDHRAAGLTFCADPRLFGRPQTGCWALLLAFEAPPPSSLIAHQ